MKTTNDTARNAAIDTMLSSLSCCGNVVVYVGDDQYTITVLEHEVDFSIVATLEVLWASSGESQTIVHEDFVSNICDRLFLHLFVESVFA